MALLHTLLFTLAFAADPGSGEPETTTEASSEADADDASTEADAGADASSEADADEPATPPDATAPVVQHYAMRQTFTSEMRDPNPFSRTGWRSTHTNTFATVEMTRKGDAVSWDEKTCSVETEKVFGASTIYTDAFMKAIPVRKRTGRILADQGNKFVAGPYVQSFGVTLADPYNDPLPTSPDDPRLVDTDKDGHPGTTVVIKHPLVGQGEVYVAQRSVARLEGRVSDDGRIQGVIFTAPDMYKIEANRWWLRGDTPQRQHPDPGMSPFVMVPMDEAPSCAAVLSQRGSLFPALDLP